MSGRIVRNCTRLYRLSKLRVARRDDFEPIVSEELFDRVQAVLTGRTPTIATRQLSATVPCRELRESEARRPLRWRAHGVAATPATVRAIDAESYERHRNKLRQELTLARIDRNTTQLEELDVGLLAFASACC